MGARKVVAIHQPNFFPWLGYFDKICRADLFVYLDHVENNPRDPLWTKRVKIIASNGESWLTVPLVRPKSSIFVPIKEMQVSTGYFERKHLRTIQQSYGKSPFFEATMPMVETFYASNDVYIADRNIQFIEELCTKLGVTTQRVRSSEFTWKNKSTDLLIEILEHFKATAYLCGGGASGYQEDFKFAEFGFDLIYQRFSHPTYEQRNTKEFHPGLSIIDVLMNCGFGGTEKLVKTGKF